MMKKLLTILLLGACTECLPATIYFKNTLPIPDENFTITWYKFDGWGASGSWKYDYSTTKGLPKSISTDAVSFSMRVDIPGPGPLSCDNPGYGFNSKCYGAFGTVIDGKEYVLSFSAGGSMPNITVTPFDHKE